jgi:hypothetical protein
VFVSKSTSLRDEVRYITCLHKILASSQLLALWRRCNVLAAARQALPDRILLCWSLVSLSSVVVGCWPCCEAAPQEPCARPGSPVPLR